MGLSGHHHHPHYHQNAYDAVCGGRHPHHEVTHELLAAAIGFEVMRVHEHHLRRRGVPAHHPLAKELLAALVAAEIDRHFETGHYRHLSRHKAHRLAQEQAEYLWEQRYGRF